MGGSSYLVTLPQPTALFLCACPATFLKYLAMQCIEGNFQANRIPVFITLKDFAEIKETPDLFTYINQLIELPTLDNLREILQQGQILVLLDGLDEVREEDTKRVLRQILEFSDQFHLNQFVMTCRIAAKEYTFERFTEVEVADFDPEQIAIFAQNWFRLSDPAKAERFIQKLEENEPILELASSPLLLTLLCLVFGESSNFPENRSELYKEGLDVLLKKWDGKRNIEREQLYKNLPLKRKEDLLSQIALTTFEQKDYFFKQKTLEAYISDFIRNLPNVDSDPEILRMDSEAVLRSIEAQHGLFVERAKNIYSFSHLTFQEYFAAKEIVANSAYENLVKHLTEKRWREVFLLSTSMMRNADTLLRLMKQNIDSIIIILQEELNQFFFWVQQKATSVSTVYKPAAVRIIYFALDLATVDSLLGDVIAINALELAENIDAEFKNDNGYYELGNDLDIDISLANALQIALLFSTGSEGTTEAIAKDSSIYSQMSEVMLNIVSLVPDNLSCAMECALDSKLKQQIQQLKEQLPIIEAENPSTKIELFMWMVVNCKAWAEQLRAMMIEHRNIGHNWQFSDAQKQLLWQYYDANKLLVDCLNSDCYVSRDVRQEIEDTLLLPISEIVRDRTSPA